jgi:hypothetical protein
MDDVYMLPVTPIVTGDTSVFTFHMRPASVLRSLYVVRLKRSVNGTRKQNRRYKQFNFIGLQNNRHSSQRTVGNVHKASGNCQQRPLFKNLSQNRCTGSTVGGLLSVSPPEEHHERRLRTPDQGSTVDHH